MSSYGGASPNPPVPSNTSSHVSPQSGRDSPFFDEAKALLQDVLETNAEQAAPRSVGIAGRKAPDGGQIPGAIQICPPPTTLRSEEMTGSTSVLEASKETLTTINLEESLRKTMNLDESKSKTIRLSGTSHKTLRLDDSSHRTLCIDVPSTPVAAATLGVPSRPSLTVPVSAAKRSMMEMSGLSGSGLSASCYSSQPVEVPWSFNAAADLTGLIPSFFIMERRRMRRYRHGRLRRRGLLGHLAYALQILLGVILGCHLVAVDWHEIKEHRWIPSLLTVGMVLIALFQTCTRPEHLFTEWMRVELFVFVLWLSWEYDQTWHENQKCYWWRWCSSHNEMVLFRVFSVVFGTTVMCFFLRQICAPLVLHKYILRSGEGHRWWQIKPVSRHETACFVGLEMEPLCADESSQKDSGHRFSASCFSYRPFGWFSCFRSQFGYVGEKDAEGRPHGKGIWFDNTFHGECLRGNWIHGEPRGTFTSREYGTGAQFAQRPIAYATSRGDCLPDNIGNTTLFPRKAGQLRYGFAQVEVSYAGGFYTFLPLVDHRHHFECKSVSDVMRRITKLLQPRSTSKESLAANNKSPNQLSPDAGFKDPAGGMNSKDFGPRSPAFGHTQLMMGQLEALVFIHGFNADLRTALGRMGQLCALGKMAPYIVPFVFSFSGGSAVSYFAVKQSMPEYAEDLRTFFLGLGRIFKTIHIIGHSCGADFFFVNFPELTDCFAQVPDPGQTNTTETQNSSVESLELPRLRNVIMINGDVLVCTVCSMLPTVMRYAERFTAYNDRNDNPLFWSEFVQTYFPYLCCLKALLKGASMPGPDQRPMVFGKEIFPLWLEASPTDGKQVVAGPFVQMLDKRENRMSQFSNNLRSIVPSVDTSKQNDRIDIIDCSSIDQNVHKMRHFYYMLNTQVVEDICDLIVCRTPARDRSRLVKVEGNIFNFLCPPANLVEI